MIKRKTGLIFAGILSLSLITGCGSRQDAAMGASNASDGVAEGTEVFEDKEDTGEEVSDPADDKNEAGSNTEKTGKDADKEDGVIDGSGDGPVVDETDGFYAQFKDWTFYFMSGAGAWETHLQIENDGSFSGEYYDADMGDTGEGYEDGGTMYDCRFKGRFSEPKKVSDNSYELRIESLDYEQTPGEEEIKDGIRYVYTGAYGLGKGEGSTLTMYLPGYKMKELPEETMSWLSPMHFSCYLQDEFYQAVPDELPFYVMNEAEEGTAFYAEYEGSDNKFFLQSTGCYPGIVNVKHELHEDGTYYFEDANKDHTFEIINACIPGEKDMNIYSMGSEEFAKKVISGIFDGEIRDLYCLDSKNYFYNRPAMVNTDGYNCIYAGWEMGGNEDTKRYTAKITQVGNYNYIYACVSSEYDESTDTEAIGFLIETLTISAQSKHLSTAYPDSKGGDIRKFYAIVKNDAEKDSILADEVKWIGPGDEDLMKQYDIDPDEMMDDYAIVEADEDYRSYRFGEDCPCYIQFPEDLFRKHISVEEFSDWLKTNESRLMIMCVDESDTVRFIYEPYTP